jgi:hypothetical protein
MSSVSPRDTASRVSSILHLFNEVEQSKQYEYSFTKIGKFGEIRSLWFKNVLRVTYFNVTRQFCSATKVSRFPRYPNQLGSVWFKNKMKVTYNKLFLSIYPKMLRENPLCKSETEIISKLTRNKVLSKI